jgi:thiamine biosynthesis lipoprotein
MSALTFRAMGTDWWASCDRPALLAEVEGLVRALEARLSRFLAGSALSRLNRERRCEDPLLAAVVREAEALRRRTGGAFDPRLGARIAALGYDRDLPEVARSPAPALPRGAPERPEVQLRGHEVRLTGAGALDLGGIAKGWAVDAAHDLLRERGAAWALVDGGGDLRGSGRRHVIGVGGGHAVALEGAALEGGAVATSSTQRRRWPGPGGERHHLLDPDTGLPAGGGLVAASVRAPTAALADALATALIARPSLAPALSGLGAAALVTDRDGQRWATAGWEAA